MMNDQRFQVRVSIVLASLMMLIVRAKGGKRLQPLIDVLDKPALIIINVNPSSDVHGGDKNHSVLNPRFLQGALDLRSQVNVGSLRFRVQGQVFGVEFHWSILNTKRVNHRGGACASNPK